jgi:hypothetical protein
MRSARSSFTVVQLRTLLLRGVVLVGEAPLSRAAAVYLDPEKRIDSSGTKFRNRAFGCIQRGAFPMDMRFVFSALAGIFIAVLIVATITTVRHVSNRPTPQASAKVSDLDQGPPKGGLLSGVRFQR